MDDEVFWGLGPLGSPRFPQASLALLETCRRCLEKESLSGEARPPVASPGHLGLLRDLRKTVWRIRLLGG